MRIAKDAWIFVLPLLVATLLLYFLHWLTASGVSLALTLFILYFFRDPEREIPADPLAVVSPADGRVMEVEPVNVGGASRVRIGIFLSVFDVHINRSPIAGRVTSVRYQKGKFEAAFKKSVSMENEQNRLTIAGRTAVVEVAQIAGLIARRIVCYKGEGDTVLRGERIGLIKFGSKTDCLLPPDAEVRVRVGEHVRGGASTIARLKGE
ncbi:MAG: phosphatidylserine decarboxylase family protein [Acidobacteriia bacterium]|nr:phosphatidylserine decarboxylase family protein [Terriglobia bacterium]